MRPLGSIADRLSRYQVPHYQYDKPIVEGRLTRLIGLTMEAVGISASIGCHCEVIAGDGRRIQAEVVGFSHEKVYLMPVKSIEGLQPGARVVPILHEQNLLVPKTSFCFLQSIQ